jgi:hypothetical protein
LILLCPTHHAFVDVDPETWTVDRLHEAKDAHENWVSQELQDGLLDTDRIQGIIDTIGRSLEHDRLLTHLLRIEAGNARFLAQLQEAEDYWIFRYNVGASRMFRDEFLTFLDEMYPDGGPSPPFTLPMHDGVVAFPEGYEDYAHEIRDPPLERPTVPVLVELATLGKDDRGHFLQGGRRQVLPDLPMRNGFIQSVNLSTGLPDLVGDEPSNRYWGAYYWVKPRGLRIIVSGIAVADPLEAAYGRAVWWSTTEARPFFGFRPVRVRRITPETEREDADNLRAFYRQLVARLQAADHRSIRSEEQGE